MPSLHVFTKKYCYCHANLDSKSHLVSHYVFLSKVRATLGRGSCCSRSQIANAFLYAFLCLLLRYGSYSSQFVELCILQMWSCCGTKCRICAVSSVWLFSFYLRVYCCVLSVGEQEHHSFGVTARNASCRYATRSALMFGSC